MILPLFGEKSFGGGLNGYTCNKKNLKNLFQKFISLPRRSSLLRRDGNERNLGELNGMQSLFVLPHDDC